MLAEIAYYGNRHLGARFQAEVESTSEIAAKSPKSGAPVAGVARRRLLPTLPLSLIYTETDFGIVVTQSHTAGGAQPAGSKGLGDEG